MIKSLYLIGSLRNPRVPIVAQNIRDATGIEVFDDWYAAGPEADDYWQRYEQGRRVVFTEALRNYPAQHVYNYDKHHLDRCDAAALLLPAGKSGHLELGYMIGRGKKAYIVLDKYEDPERWDVMYNFASAVFYGADTLIQVLTYQARD